MIKKLRYIEAKGTNPYENLALEEYILQNVKSDEIIMYLWQNKKTVVIGRNQNCYAQCKVNALADDNGFLARRLSGGGAVFHDLGNLNFTFAAHEDNYDFLRQSDVIVKAVNSFGINAALTGRNDILTEGRKFSGNAFYKSRNHKLHHGTLLLNTDMKQLSNYLTVSGEKLKGHGVESVKSRVINLCDLNSSITVQSMKNAMLCAFESVYGLKHTQIKHEKLDNQIISELTQKYASDEWRLGANKAYTYTLKRRFPWGEAELCFNVSGTKIESAVLFTDALDDSISQTVQKAIESCEFNKNLICNALLSAASSESAHKKAAMQDLANLVQQEIV